MGARKATAELVGTCQRQPDLKASVTGLGMHLYATAMFLYDPLHGIESQASSITDTLGSKERLKNARLHLWGNARPIVADLNHDTLVLAIGPHAEFARPPIASIALSMMLVQTWLSSLPKEFTS